jgi:hypothetical protein
MASNPANLSIPAGSQGAITCLANAAYYQRVTLSWGSTTVIFSGTGEGIAMTTSTGDQLFLIPPNKDALSISATFEYSTTGKNGTYGKASVNTPIISDKGGFHVIEVTSEDSTDNDNNDSYLTITTVAK